MSYIDYTYFVGDISLPISSNVNLRTAITEAITAYEDEILKKLLGYTLWKALDDDLVDGAPQTQIYKDLVNGAEFSFTYEGYTINTKWEGLVNSAKKSLLAYYTYYQYRRDFVGSSTGVGEVVNKPENAIIVSPIPKMVNAWNRMIDLYGETPLYLAKYPDYFLLDSNYEHYNTKPSAYNFLLANISDYPDWVFTPLKKKHRFEA